MQDQTVEPLDTELWFAELEKLRAWQIGMGGEAPDAPFRKALYLVQLAPAQFRAVIPAHIDEGAFETFLDCGAYVEAAVRLIGDQAAVSLQRKPGSAAFTAAVQLYDNSPAGEGDDDEPGRALLRAWCQCALALWPLSEELPSPLCGRDVGGCSPGDRSATHLAWQWPLNGGKAAAGDRTGSK